MSEPFENEEDREDALLLAVEAARSQCIAAG